MRDARERGEEIHEEGKEEMVRKGVGERKRLEEEYGKIVEDRGRGVVESIHPLSNTTMGNASDGMPWVYVWYPRLGESSCFFVLGGPEGVLNRGMLTRPDTRCEPPQPILPAP